MTASDWLVPAPYLRPGDVVEVDGKRFTVVSAPGLDSYVLSPLPEPTVLERVQLAMRAVREAADGGRIGDDLLAAAAIAEVARAVRELDVPGLVVSPSDIADRLVGDLP